MPDGDTSGGEVEALPPSPAPLPGGWRAGVDHKTVGTVYLGLALAFLVVGGVLALVMRTQLVTAHTGLVGPRAYRQFFTLHGVISVFLFLVPAYIGLATALVPLQIGSSRVAFPRVNAFALWLFVAGGVMIVASPLARRGAAVSGWSLSLPLPEGRAARGHGVDLLILGMGVVGVAIVVAAVNLLTTVVKLRAPGLTLRRAPLFTWSVLVSTSVLLLVTPVLVAGLAMLFVDRHFGGHIFTGATGAGRGNPLLWPRLFWFFAYPALWAMVVAAFGIVAEVVPVFARRPLAARPAVFAGLAITAVLGFAGWGSQVPRLSSRARPLFTLTTLAVLGPPALCLLVLLGTVAAAVRRRQRDEARLRSPLGPPAAMLHALGFVAVVGLGLAAALVSALTLGTSLRNSQWQVATQHLLFFGAPAVALVAGLHYWAPKLWGRHLSESLGALQAVLLVGGAVLSFAPLAVLGVQGMKAHRATYPASQGWEPANLVATAGAYLFTLAVGLLALNLLVSVAAQRGRAADADPWQGYTLEWATASPPPPHNFDSLPEVRSERPLADLREAQRATPELGEGSGEERAAVMAGSAENA